VEKRGLTTTLREAGGTAQTYRAWGDERRVGLYGQVRKVWAPRGVKVRQRLQLQRVWRYLALAVDGRCGTVTWRWVANMRGPAIAEAAQHWRADGEEAVVWDGAHSHTAPEVQQVGLTLLQQPPYAPELNPAERVFEELRRAVEGHPYASIEDKVAAVERELHALAADPERVKRLTGWQWIHDACEQLPQKVAPL
jgi:hypothetical protein